MVNGPYLKRHEPVEQGILRFAHIQVDTALASVRNPDVPRDTAIHQIRKCCKQMRAMIRLVAPALDDFKTKDVIFREIGKKLAGARDAKVMIDTFAKLSHSPHYDKDEERHRTIKEYLRNHQQGHKAYDMLLVLDECQSELIDLRHQMTRWQLNATGWDAIGPGLRDTYRRARKKMLKADRSGHDEDFHAWRKHLKYHSYQMEIIIPLQPEHLRKQASRAREIGEWLGDHHDLAVLEHKLHAMHNHSASNDRMKDLRHLARVQRDQLAENAMRMGHKLMDEKPDIFEDRLANYWRAWQHESKI